MGGQWFRLAMILSAIYHAVKKENPDLPSPRVFFSSESQIPQPHVTQELPWNLRDLAEQCIENTDIIGRKR
jgi:hypothetical protein